MHRGEGPNTRRPVAREAGPHAAHARPGRRAATRRALVPVSARLDLEQPIEPDRFVREFVPHDRHRPLTRAVSSSAWRAAGRRARARWRFTPLGERVNVASLAHALATLTQRPAAPALLLAGYVVAATFAVPITLLITATGPVFGAWPGGLRGRRHDGGRGRELRDRPLARAGCGAGSPAHARTGSASTSAGAACSRCQPRLLPIAPFTVVNLVAGASHIGLRDYLCRHRDRHAARPRADRHVRAPAHSRAEPSPAGRAFAWLAAIGLALVGISVLLVRVLRRWR